MSAIPKVCITIPIEANGKKPLIRWKDIKAPLTTHERSAYHGSNWAILTGARNGLTVIGVNARDGGMEAWASLVAEYGPVDTTYQETPNGGLHFLFQYDPDIASPVAKVNGVGIDVRSDGSYIVAWPSKIDGKQYKLVGELQAAKIMPAWLKSWLMKDPKCDRASKEARKRIADDPTAMGGIPQVLRDMTSHERLDFYLTCIDPNTGYDEWFSALCAARNLCGLGVDHIMRTWSAQSPKFEGDDAFKAKWESLKDRKDGYDEGTLIRLARIHNPERFASILGTRADWIEDMNTREFETYDMVKREFETKVFMLYAPPCYIQVLSDGSYMHITRSNVRDVYGHLCYYEYKNGAYTKAPFLPRWFVDKDRRSYEYEDFDPSGLLGPGILNRYKGLVAERLAPVAEADVADLVRPILDHIRDVITGDEDFDFMIKWIADIIQRPGRSPAGNVAILLHGEQGVGKNIIFSFLQHHVIGTEHASQTGSALIDLFDKHANAAIYKLLVIVDEINRAQFIRNNDALKNMITCETIRYEPKGIDATTVANHARFLFTTNNRNPIQISYDDRRMVAFACSNVHKNDFNYFERLGAHLERPEVARAFYQYLMGIDLTNITNFQMIRPMTRFYRELQRLNLSPLDRWMSYLSIVCPQNANVHAQIDGQAGTELMAAFLAWAAARQYRMEGTNLTAFTRKLGQIAGVSREKSGSTRRYRFDWAQIRAALERDQRFDEAAE